MASIPELLDPCGMSDANSGFLGIADYSGFPPPDLQSLAGYSGGILVHTHTNTPAYNDIFLTCIIPFSMQLTTY